MTAKNDIKLEIVRETGSMYDKKSHWLNRYVQDPATKEVLYYCDTDAEDHKLTFHRGGKDGPIIATATPCLEKEGSTDIQFHDPSFTFPLVHTHHKLPTLTSKTSFSTKGKDYHWQGHKELIDDSTKDVVAKFHPTWLEGSGHKIGTLEVSQKDIQDIVVITTIVVQERTDEHKVSVEMARKRAMEIGIAGF